MDARRAVAPFLLSLVVTAATFGQEAAPASPAEFERASGGAIELMTKHARPFSGTLSLTQGGSRGYGATLGGTLVPDRVWFFASALKSTPLATSQYVQQPAAAPALDAKVLGQVGDRQNLAASFAKTQQTPMMTTDTSFGSSTFLSLRYTGIVSDNMFVTASFSQLQHSNPGN